MKRYMTASLLVLSLTACSMTPDYERPGIDIPSGYYQQSVEGTNTPTRDWWKTVDSAELNRLITAALDNNNDLKAALYRIDQSRAASRIAGASLLPTLGASGGASLSRSDPPGAKANNTNSTNAGLSAAYELDLFGANRAAIEAAEASEQGTRYNRDALALVTMSDTAQTFFNLVNLRERMTVAENNLRITQDVLNIIQARFDAGAVSGLELSQQKTQVASNQASLTSLQEQETNTLNALAILLGQAPQNTSVVSRKLEGLTIPSIKSGIPSDLLQRRPDIASAETALIAANADIGAARAAFFPKVNLSSGFSITRSPIGDPMATALSLAASIAQPIFQGGRLEAGVDRATARQLELVENYRKTVLVAFQEVEDALAAVNASEARNTALTAAADQAQIAYNIAQQQYDSGLVDFQTMLSAQATLLNAQDALTQSRAARLNAAVSLYKALGGGWQA